MFFSISEALEHDNICVRGLTVYYGAKAEMLLVDLKDLQSDISCLLLRMQTLRNREILKISRLNNDRREHDTGTCSTFNEVFHKVSGTTPLCVGRRRNPLNFGADPDNRKTLLHDLYDERFKSVALVITFSYSSIFFFFKPPQRPKKKANKSISRNIEQLL